MTTLTRIPIKEGLPRAGFDGDGVLANAPHIVHRMNNAKTTSRHYPLRINGASPERISDHFDELWIRRTDEIGLVHPEIPLYMAKLVESGALQVIVLTSAAGGDPRATPRIEKWLDGNEIMRHDFQHVPSTEAKVGKAEIYIDDDPGLVRHLKNGEDVLLVPQYWTLGELRRSGYSIAGRTVYRCPEPETLHQLNGNHSSGAKTGLIILARPDLSYVHDAVLALAEMRR